MMSRVGSNGRRAAGWGGRLVALLLLATGMTTRGQAPATPPPAARTPSERAAEPPPRSGVPAVTATPASALPQPLPPLPPAGAGDKPPPTSPAGPLDRI